jgi:hypothetical protein
MTTPATEMGIEPCCRIFVNGEPYDVAEHYAKHHHAPLPSTPTMTVCELAGVGGFWDAKPTYRKDGSRVTHEQNYCVVECDENGEWHGPTWTVVKDCNRSIALHDGQRFDAFPEGYY